MKKIFTLFLVFAGAFTLLAQNPYVNEAKTGLANNFNTEADVNNDYLKAGWQFNQDLALTGDTVTLTWMDGAMKIEAKYAWDYALARFLVSTDLSETIDITNNIHVSFDYKNLTQDIALTASFRNDVGDGELLYGGEVWLEGGDVVYESSDWNTVDMDFAIEDGNVNKVVLLEIGVDGIGDGSVIIDNLVFGDIEVSAKDIEISETGIEVFPNPASDYLQIRNAGPEFDATFINVIGQQVMSVQNMEQIDLAEMDRGLYFLQVNSKGKKDTFKVFVE